MTKWQMVPLGDVLHLQRRWVKVDPLATYEEIGVRCFGNGIFHKSPIDGSTLGNKRVLRIEPGDLVFNNVFAWEGAVAVASEAEAGKIGSHRFVTYTADGSRCSVDYLRWFFKSEPGLEVLRRVSPGSAGRNRTMSLDQLPKQEIPLPPLKHQHRLVEYLDAHSAMITEARLLRDKATLETEAFGDSVLQREYQRHCDRHGVRALSGLITEAGYGTSVKCDYTTVDASVPVLRIPNVAAERVNFEDLKHAVLPETDLNKTLLSPGDILVVRTNGSAALVGRVAVVPALPGPTAFASYLIRLRVDRSLVEPEYLRHLLKHLRTSGKLFDLARTTAGQYNVSLGRLGAAEIPVPPLPEQRDFVKTLAAFYAELAEVHAHQQESRIQIVGMLAAILDQIFNGDAT